MLVLGSMPGVASLEAQQYYAHPRNAFWPIMCDLFGIDPAWQYVERCSALMDRQIAVWDVLKHCQRPGSLDADILPDSIVANDFQRLFAGHRQVASIFFNGSAAERLFRRHVRLPVGALTSEQPVFVRLPSTSPAHAAMSQQQKSAAWTALRDALGDTNRN